jgi:hypothetical protein
LLTAQWLHPQFISTSADGDLRTGLSSWQPSKPTSEVVTDVDVKTTGGWQHALNQQTPITSIGQ